MKIIYPKREFLATATGYDPAWPPDNLADPRPKKKVQFPGDSGTVNIIVSAGSAGCALFYIVAASVNIRILDGGAEIISQLFETDKLPRAWLEYPRQAGECSVEITLTGAPGSVVSAGVFRVGEIVAAENPNYGLQRRWKNYGYRETYASGKPARQKGDMARMHTLTLDPPHLMAETLENIFFEAREEPLAILEVDGIDRNQYYSIFGVVEKFDGDHADLLDSEMGLEILEET